MTRIKLLDKYFVPYIAAADIEAGVESVANKINNCYTEHDSILFVSVLSGAYMFTSDLMKHITIDAEIAFIKVASYKGTSSSMIEMIIDVTSEVKDRDIIITDELVDRGQTVNFLKDRFIKMGAKSVKIATLIKKPRTMQAGTEVDFHAIEMLDNNFIVGYGLDYNEKGRTLKDIYILDEDQK